MIILKIAHTLVCLVGRTWLAITVFYSIRATVIDGGWVVFGLFSINEATTKRTTRIKNSMAHFFILLGLVIWQSIFGLSKLKCDKAPPIA
jgi:hypothetical protein|tara:strand:+ start:2489 stop:2758 length:270 start_codon:yes stop_codon:yes gene_type:complete